MEIEKCPMPGCGGECKTSDNWSEELDLDPIWSTYCSKCDFVCSGGRTEAEAIAAHNELATAAEVGRLVMALTAEDRLMAFPACGGYTASRHDAEDDVCIAESHADALLDALRGLAEESE